MRELRGGSYQGSEAAVLYVLVQDGPGQVLSCQASLSRTRTIDIAPGQVLLVGTDAEVADAVTALGLVPFVPPAIPEADAVAIKAQRLLDARDRIDAELSDPKMQAVVEGMQSAVRRVNP
jgi:hypothetical protein